MICATAEAALRAYSRITPTERGGFRLARLVRRLRPHENWIDTFTTPDGIRLKLDLATYPDVCMAYGLYELDTARLIKRLLKPGDHFVDAGANLGYFTLLAAKLVGSNGMVDAFEPHPTNRARLIAHLADNGLTDRVRVHAVALSDQAGFATMHMPHDAQSNHGMASLYSPAGGSDTVEVPTARMDETIGDAHPKLIKIDVEGAEPLAVAGMAALVQVEHPPMIIAEYNVDTARQAGTTPRAFIDRLRALQPAYKTYLIGWKLRRIESLDDALQGRAMANLLFATEL